MDEIQKKIAWEPLTPRGVAAFARAPLVRLLLVQLVFALLAAASAGWFLDDSYFPIVRRAIQHLPDTGEIRSGRLNGSDNPPQSLAEGRFLAFDLDPDHSGQIHSTADVQIEFGRETVRVSSLAGYAEYSYPRDRVLPFNRPELDPLWGAWMVEILFIAVVAAVLGLLLIWSALAAIYLFPAWVLGFFMNRDLNFRAGWKLSGAALMPGALLMAAAILFYNSGLLNLVSFAFFFIAHLALGWIYLFFSLLFLPRISSTRSKENPFASLKKKSG